MVYGVSGMQPIREVELAVIGCVINGGRTDLLHEDFTSPDLRAAYKAIEKMVINKESIDLVTLDAATNSTMTITLQEAMGVGFMKSMLPQYTAIIKDNATRLKGIAIAQQTISELSDKTSETDSVFESAKKQYADINLGKRHAWSTSTEVAAATYGWLESLKSGKVKPITSGISGLDYMIGGFFPGELTVIGAKPGTGKTVMGMIMAINAARAGVNVGVVNVEMIDTQYGSRMFSNLGSVDAMKIRKGEFEENDWLAIAKAANELSNLSASFMFTNRYIEDIGAAAREHGKLGMLFVDYMQNVKTKQKTESERMRMAHISWALKELAVDLRIPVIAMSQLRRPESGSENKMPSMRDLRESGNLEADADGIILMHEPTSAEDKFVHKDHKQAFEGWQDKGMRYICLNVEKQRQGMVGVTSVLFDAKHMRYFGISKQQEGKA